MKISIGQSNRKSFAHNHRVTTSTTCDFSFVQPIFSRMMIAGSSIKGSLRQFMRLAPMPFPTFGEVKLRNIAQFIPIEQVYPAFSALMAQKEYVTDTGSITYPTRLPNIDIRYLSEMLLKNYTTSKVYINNANSIFTDDESSLKLDLQECPLEALYDEYQKLVADGVDFNVNTIISPIVCNCSITLNKQHIEVFKRVFDKSITIEDAKKELGYSTLNAFPDEIASVLNGADYINLYSGSNSDKQVDTVTIYNYTVQGRALRKVLIGLGYKISLDDDTRVNILPLIMFHKAYYNALYPTNLDDWQTSKAYHFVQKCLNYNVSDLGYVTPTTSQSAELNDLFQQFFDEELTQLYSTSDTDYVSAQMSNPSNNQNIFASAGTPNGYRANVGYTEQGKITNSDSDHVSEGFAGANPSISPTTSNPLTAWQLKFLTALQKYVNRDSVIGNRLELWMKNHLDSDVYNQLFKSVDYVASNYLDVTISDIDSTSDTTGSDGLELGAYAGKGVGSGNMTFNYKANTYGLFVIMSWISPTTGYYQGTDARLFSLDKWQMPSSEFDALGYEVTPLSFIFTDNGISLANVKKSATDQTNRYKTIKDSDGFGYMPRYSSWKYAKNIVNGDMSRRSRQSTYAPFYLDRQIVQNYVNVKRDGGNITDINVQVNPIPLASTIWRYTSRANFLSNYNRIFYNSGDGVSATPNLDDNFILHCVIDFTEVNSLKPLSLSYYADGDSGSQSIQLN